MEKRYALLIDAENTEIKYLDSIISESKKYGSVTYKRMYGDFTSQSMRDWNKKAAEYAIIQIQQPHYSKFKNSADIMLVIDAMDILYNDNVEGFCLVSRDSDFSRLVSRLCESGKEVIGMGSSNASASLIAACTEYKRIDMIFAGEGENGSDQQENREEDSSVTSLDKIRESISEVVMLRDNKANLGEVKNTLLRLYPDFDERNYNFSSFRKLIESLNGFVITQELNTLIVSMADQYSEEEIKNAIIEIVSGKPMRLSSLSTRIRGQFKNFSCREYGYNQFKKFVSSIDGVRVDDDGMVSFMSAVIKNKRF